VALSGARRVPIQHPVPKLFSDERRAPGPEEREGVDRRYDGQDLKGKTQLADESLY